MLANLRIKNFKNFNVEEDILVFEHERDSLAFTIFVGKNGAGKSSVFDAIEWVLFNKGMKSMRASKQDDLISDGQNFMYVKVEFKSRIGDLSLVVTKELHKGKQSRIFALLTGTHDSLPTVINSSLEGFDKIANALREYFDINVSQFEKIVMKQQSISTISCAEAKNLLSSLETYIGTDVIKAAARSLIADRDLVIHERKDIWTARNDLALNIKKNQPAVDEAISIRQEERLFAISLLKLRISEKKALKQKELSQELQYRDMKSKQSDVLDNIGLADALKVVLREEMRSLRIAGTKKNRATESCDEVLHREQEALEDVILARNQEMRKARASASKIKGILNLVS